MSSIAALSGFLYLVLLTQCNLSTESDDDCPSSWFKCGNGKCVAKLWLCDGDNDCGNMKDEENCDDCPSSWFKCGNEKCIANTLLCDGNNDCGNMKDEENCENSTECPGFLCKDNHCIPSEWKCDGQKDCMDGSDEDPCSIATICSENEFTCLSGSCVNLSCICDGKKDCSDASDEGKNCSDTCTETTCSQKCRKTPTGPKCYCEDGYKLSKDNKACTDINECEQEGSCSHSCINFLGGYTCSCLPGYESENRTCRAKGAEPLLIFSTLQEIRGLYLRSNRNFLIQKAVNKAAAVDADPTDQRVYWIEISNKSSVYSSKIDGSGFTTILSNGLMVPEDIAVDYIGRNVYITDSSLKQVLACKMDGTMCHVLHDTDIDKPRAIALDPAEGLLYWSDWGKETAGIYRSGMDGSGRIALVSKDIIWPNSIAVDHSTNRLFWADAHFHTIEYITLDGKTRKVVIKDSVHHPYSLTVFEDNLYWTDWSTFTLDSCDKFTGHKITLIPRENGKHLMGVHVYHPVLAASAENPCLGSTCSHMCVIAPSKTFRCVCPPGYNLSIDNKTCIMDNKFPSLFISEDSRIYHVRPEVVGSDAVTTVPVNHIDVIGKVAYDWKSRSLFICDMSGSAIHSVNMTSFLKKELVKNHLVTPEDLSFDWMTDNLYWVDSTKGTVEVVNTKNLNTAPIITGLGKPVAIVVAPPTSVMFVSTMDNSAVAMYDMDGKNRKELYKLSGIVMSLAVHPTKTLLFWADPQAETISSIDYVNPKSDVMVQRTQVGSVESIAVSDKYLYWTDTKSRHLHILKENTTHAHILALPGIGSSLTTRKIAYSAVPTSIRSADSASSRTNGGCSHLFLNSPKGISCACPTGMVISSDNVTCQEPFFRCPENDFRCRNGRCILLSWKCDFRNDCGDNSDEEDCPAPTNCTKDQFSCKDGECISLLWKCDGENDCSDKNDEENCHESKCDEEQQLRCDNGQCIPRSWICDGTPDCVDSTDERNCTPKAKSCDSTQFRCQDGSCITKEMVCDERNDCQDGSDEHNCTTIKECSDGEYLCRSSKRCIPRRWLCDGDEDCDDGADEDINNCTKSKKLPTPIISQPRECEEFYCYVTGKCLPWSQVCDGQRDCEDLPDEGGLCSKSCQSNNDGCSQLCTRTPQGPKCHCFSGYGLMPDGKTCEDLNECLTPGHCSHFCNNTKGGFKCSCADGYFLEHDHRSCKADGGAATLVYLLKDEMRGIDLSTHSQRVYVSDEMMRGMDFDAAGVFFWSDWNEGTINSYTLDTRKKDVLVRDQNKPNYVRWDWIAGNIYYTDDNGSVKACEKSGKYCVTVVKEIAPHINSFVISPPNGLMFCGVWSVVLMKGAGIIERAELDGSHRVVIISNDIMYPNAITVDEVLKWIFWTDSKLNTLEYADFHGLHRKRVLAGDMYYPFSMTLFEDFVFYADWETDSFIRCEKFSGKNCLQFHKGNVRAEDMMAVHKVRQPKGENRCSKATCPHLCLPNRSSFSCKCADHNSTCELQTTPRPIFKPRIECPEKYCEQGAKCVVVGGKFYCQCPYQFYGKRCENKIFPTEAKTGEAKTDEGKDEEAKTEEAKTAEEKTEEAKAEEAKTAEEKTDEAKTEEAKTEEAKAEEAKTDEAKTEEAKTAEEKTDEAKTDEAKAEEAKTVEEKTDEAKTEEAKTEEAKAEEAKTDEAKTDY